ncbi:MAG: META domain-containing protein [Acidimicrobiia bacterium]
MGVAKHIWSVISLWDESGALAPPIDGTALTLQFDGSRISGSSGCNRYSGPATFGSSCSVGPLVTTRMMCLRPDGVMEQERHFLELLDRVDRYVIEGADRLRLLDENREVVVDLESTTTPPGGAP